MAGKGICGHHTTEADKEKIGVTISVEYCFMTPLEKTEDTCPMLVLYGNWLEACRALPVSNKGLVRYVIDWCVGILVEAGYRGKGLLYLESDDEPSIVALKKGSGRHAQGGDTPHRDASARVKS